MSDKKLTRPPADFDTYDIAQMAEKADIGGLESSYQFALTFLRLREIDRHLSDLNHMQRDIDWLKHALSSTDRRTQYRPIWNAALHWLEVEAQRHRSAVEMLRGDVAAVRASYPKIAAAAEIAARPTFGKWLTIAGGQDG